MSHSCFNHSSTDGHLGCLHILVIVNNTAMNIEMLTFFQISVLGSFRYIPRSGSLGQKADPLLIFWGDSILLSTVVVATVCIPTNNAWGFPFLHTLASTCHLLIYWWCFYWKIPTMGSLTLISSPAWLDPLPRWGFSISGAARLPLGRKAPRQYIQQPERCSLKWD